MTGSRYGRPLAIPLKRTNIRQALLPAPALRSLHHRKWLLLFELPIDYLRYLIIHPLHLLAELPVLPDQLVLLDLLGILSLLPLRAAQLPNGILELSPLSLLPILLVESLMVRVITLRMGGLLRWLLLDVTKLTCQVFGTAMRALIGRSFTNWTVVNKWFFGQNCTALVHLSSLGGQLRLLGRIRTFKDAHIEFPRTTLRLLGSSVSACGDYLIVIPTNWIQ